MSIKVIAEKIINEKSPNLVGNEKQNQCFMNEVFKKMKVLSRILKNKAENLKNKSFDEEY